MVLRPSGAARQLTLFRLVGALILLTIGGVSLVVLAWLALRSGRRYADGPTWRATRAAGPPPDDWADKPLTPRGEDPKHEPDGR
jgi:hypothetical protein